MLKMPTYNKNTHTKGKKKKKQTASLPLLFYPQTLQCPNTKQVSRRKNKHTNKHTHTKKEKLKKKKKKVWQQTVFQQHNRVQPRAIPSTGGNDTRLLVGKQFGQENRPPRSAQSQRRYAQHRQ